MTATATPQIGDFVRVQSGKFAGMTGEIVNVNEPSGILSVRMTSTGRKLAFWPHELRRETRGAEPYEGVWGEMKQRRVAM